MINRPKTKFESEVHLGLLCIIGLLLFLNVISNYTLYRARTEKKQLTTADLRSAALSISRTLEDNVSDQASLLLKAKEQHNLHNVWFVPAYAIGGAGKSPQMVLSKNLSNVSTEDIEIIVEGIQGGILNEPKRGAQSIYYYLSKTQVSSHPGILIMSIDEPFLALLEDSASIVLWAGCIALILVSIIYLLVSNTIFNPFRQIAAHAIRAGRGANVLSTDAQSVVEEYSQMISELIESKNALVRLNAEISERARSLERINDFLLTSITSGIVTVNAQGGIISVNQAAQEMLGLIDNNDDAAHFDSYFAQYPAIVNRIGAGINRGSYPDYEEVRLVHQSGHALSLGISISPIRNNEHSVIGVALMLNDLTELSRLREEVEHKQRLAALGEMAAGLAHQIRNSLGAIAGFATLLKKGHAVEDAFLGTIGSLLSESKEAEDMIGRFLSFAKPLHCELEDIELEKLIAETVETFRIRPDCSGVRFVIEAKKGIIFSADSILFKQALANLLDNAVRACKNVSGLIRIQGVSRDGKVCLTITDNGAGIPHDTIPKIFTPFYSGRPDGTGLGLSLVSKIVDLHRGTVSVESKETVGTTFTIILKQAILRPDPNSHLKTPASV
ncbi:MAG: ATP-binding protein [candidate division Zixibacteria bacterium]|mgnify:CR=1 FL=1|nr:ATP-binding protein [candidate division Zixibacteria bacterium]